MSKVQEHIKTGKIWKNIEGKWCKRCPSCGSEVIGKTGNPNTMYEMSCSISKGQLCHSCIEIGKPTWSSLNKEKFGKMVSGDKHPMFGRKHTAEMKLKQRNRYLGTTLSEETKKKVSESVKKAWKNPLKREHMIDRCKWNNIAMDKGHKELIDKWNKLGFNFVLNYQLKTGNNMFYIDGYDPIHNVVLEYDSKYHNKEAQRKKDKIRQQKIIDTLKPKKFWRYNFSNKTFFQYIYI